MADIWGRNHKISVFYGRYMGAKPQNIGRSIISFPIIVYKRNNIWYNTLFFWGYGLVRITGLKLHNFRNYRDLEQAFEPGLTVFTGLNGAGKTNVLEAIFLCALGS